MKSIPVKSWLCAISAAATLMTVGLVPAVGASLPPVGTWDCVLSGQRQGTAYLQFNEDGTLGIIEAMVPNAPSSSSSSTVGRGGTGTGRSGSGGSTNAFVSSVQIFGEEATNGLWAIDAKGRTIGFFVEISEPENCTITSIPTSTNVTVSSVSFSLTNGSITDPTFCVTTPTETNGASITETEICYTNVPICTAITNAISFVGTVSTKRLVLKCSTPFGPTTYSGVPAQVLPDISGNYSGVKTQDGVSYQEFLTLTTSEDSPNIYDVSLTGPGYAYTGQSILSSQKKISFALGLVPTIPTNQNITVVRAVVGPFNAKNLSAQTMGWDGTQGTFTSKARFNVQALPLP